MKIYDIEKQEIVKEIKDHSSYNNGLTINQNEGILTSQIVFMMQKCSNRMFHWENLPENYYFD